MDAGRIDVELSLLLRMSAELLEDRLVASPYVVGEQLAKHIIEYARREKMGYYPALEFFGGVDGFDKDLLETARTIAWYVTDFTGKELGRVLKSNFPGADILGVQSVAFMMPATRPATYNAAYELERHYTPDVVRMNVILHGVDRQSSKDELRRYLKKKLKRLLGHSYELVDVSSISVLGNN